MGNWHFSRVRVTRLNKRFSDIGFAEKIFTRRMEKLRKTLNVAVPKLVVAETKKSRFYKNLTNPPIGTRGYDLPAEFGLRPGVEDLAASKLLAILQLTVKVDVKAEGEVRNVGGRMVKTIKVDVKFLDPDDYEEHFNQYPFVIESRRRVGKVRQSRKVRWMHWVLNAGRGSNAILGVDPDLKDYGISYDLDARGQARSRSGRALMVKNSGLINTSRSKVPIIYKSYTMPEAAKPSNGKKNFIEELSKSELFVNKLKAATERSMERILKLGQ